MRKRVFTFKYILHYFRNVEMSCKKTYIRRTRGGARKSNPKLFNLLYANVDVKKNGWNIVLIMDESAVLWHQNKLNLTNI